MNIQSNLPPITNIEALTILSDASHRYNEVFPIFNRCKEIFAKACSDVGLGAGRAASSARAASDSTARLATGTPDSAIRTAFAAQSASAACKANESAVKIIFSLNPDKENAEKAAKKAFTAKLSDQNINFIKKAARTNPNGAVDAAAEGDILNFRDDVLKFEYATLSFATKYDKAVDGLSAAINDAKTEATLAAADAAAARASGGAGGGAGAR